MIIKILRGVIVCGEHAEAGELVDAPEPDALRLLGMGAAERCEELAAAGEITAPDPEPAHRDPKPGKR